MLVLLALVQLLRMLLVVLVVCAATAGAACYHYNRYSYCLQLQLLMSLLLFTIQFLRLQLLLFNNKICLLETAVESPQNYNVLS